MDYLLEQELVCDFLGLLEGRVAVGLCRTATEFNYSEGADVVL
jgi:hypothetical protein